MTGKKAASMLRVKGCPRCMGDTLIERDHFGWYERCMHCGFEGDVKEIKSLTAGVSFSEKS